MEFVFNQIITLEKMSMLYYFFFLQGTVQSFIDDLFSNVLRADEGLPIAVKFLFDLLDNASRRHNIVDPEVVHVWKCNR